MYSKSMSDLLNPLLHSQMLVTQQSLLSKQLHFKSSRGMGKSRKEEDMPHSVPAKAALDDKFSLHVTTNFYHHDFFNEFVKCTEKKFCIPHRYQSCSLTKQPGKRGARAYNATEVPHVLHEKSQHCFLVIRNSLNLIELEDFVQVKNELGCVMEASKRELCSDVLLE